MHERTLREKTAVEKELDKLYAENAAKNAGDQVQSTTPAIEQLYSRVQTAERERDDALTKRDSIVNQIARSDLLYVTVELIPLTHARETCERNLYKNSSTFFHQTLMQKRRLSPKPATVAKIARPHWRL